MGTWVAIVAVIFLVGTTMGLRPSVKEKRLDRLRTQARQLGLHPKLIPAPDWIQGNSDQLGKGMIAQYGVLDSEATLTPCDYQIIDGKWRPFTHHYPANFALDNYRIDLPPSIAPYVKGLSVKANFIGIYWQENIGVNSEKLETSENDLIQLKTTLKDYKQIIKNFK